MGDFTWTEYRSPQDQRTDGTYTEALGSRIDTHGHGRPHLVELRAVCGPGDNYEPVITIMLPNED